MNQHTADHIHVIIVIVAMEVANRLPLMGSVADVHVLPVTVAMEVASRLAAWHGWKIVIFERNFICYLIQLAIRLCCFHPLEKYTSR